MRFSTVSWAALLLARISLAQNDNTTEPRSTYVSRPDLEAPALNFTVQDGFSPGYVFVSPFQNTQTAPYIFDKFGNLIWSGYGITGGGNFHDFKVCRYRGADHLCVVQGLQKSGYLVGHGLIINSNYTVVKSVNTGREAPGVDMHEFNLIEDGESALVTAYQAVPADLSAYNITTGQGWVNQGVFQEVNVSTGAVIFSWNSIKNIPLSDSHVMPNTTDVSGDGLSARTAWDYFHINSVDKSTRTGHYLISARHVSSIYYINSTDGVVLWRLSTIGNSDFECQGFNFSYQHDARFISENDTHTIISLYDNASNGFNKTSAYSSGMIVSLDHEAKTAALLANYSAPVEGGILSDSQGNTQVLPNGNVFQNYGSVPSFSEHTADGRPVLMGSMGVYPVMNYRAFSYNWTGWPTGRPTLYAFSRNATAASTSMHVSWNGATEVRTWRFYGFNATSSQYQVAGETERTGFETAYTVPWYAPWAIAEAVDGSGNGLRNSSVMRTWLPPSMMMDMCDDASCPDATEYSS